MRKFAQRGATAIALVLGLSGAHGAMAQQTSGGVDQLAGPQAPDCDPVTPGVQVDCPRDRVVVTGSNIAGAAESAALPVEVYTTEDSLKQGNQTPLEFIKSLSVVGSTIGETNQF